MAIDMAGIAPGSAGRGRSRRDFLAGCASMAAVAGWRSAHAMPARERAQFLTARRLGSRHEAVLLDARGHDVLALGLPERGHSFAIDSTGRRAVIFGRQPGFYALAFGVEDGAALGSL